MKPNFRNLFMNKFTREHVVPTISASTSCGMGLSTGCRLFAFPHGASRQAGPHYDDAASI